MGNLASSVDPGIGASGTVNRDRLTVEAVESRFELPLHAPPLALPLPAAEPATQVGNNHGQSDVLLHAGIMASFR